VFSLLFGAEAFVLFLRRAQPVLRSSVLTVHDIDEVDVTLKLGMLRSLGRCCLGLVALLVAGGAARVLPVSLSCHLPLQRTHPPAVVCCCFLCFCRDWSNHYNIWAAGGKSAFI
jgi:hypothetical protein